MAPSRFEALSRDNLVQLAYDLTKQVQKLGEENAVLNRRLAALLSLTARTVEIPEDVHTCTSACRHKAGYPSWRKADC